MKATVHVHDNHYFFEDPVAKFDIGVLRVQSMDPTREGIERYLIGERLQDSDGVDVTDYEHDNVWKFRMEVACMKMTMLTADWIELVGVVLDMQSWSYGPEDESQLAWEGATACPNCTDDEGERQRHVMVEHYTPPKVNGVSGKWVKVRMLSE